MTCIGKTLSLYDQCHGDDSNQQPCNYYPSDKFRNGYWAGYSEDEYKNRSHINVCKDTMYVWIIE